MSYFSLPRLINSSFVTSSFRRTSRWIAIRQHQRRSIAIGSAIHKGLNRDNTRRDRRKPGVRVDEAKRDVPDPFDYEAISRRMARIKMDLKDREKSWDSLQQDVEEALKDTRSIRPRTSARARNSDILRGGDGFGDAQKGRDADADQELPKFPERPRKHERARAFRHASGLDRDRESWRSEERSERRPRSIRGSFVLDGEGNSKRYSNDGSGYSNNSDPSHPLPVPHASFNSQFLYGFSTTYAALKAGKRKLYKLYLHRRADIRADAMKDIIKEQDTVRALAKELKVPIIEGEEANQRLLDKMSEGRPHNGIVLECSPLPIPVIPGAAVPPPLITTTTLNKYPVLLLIDSVLDPGNLGGILRSAYFLGIDAVVLSNHVAPLNAVALKASSGAAEALQIYSASNPVGFLGTCRKAGWSVVAATTPTDLKPAAKKKVLSVTVRGSNVRYHLPGIRSVDDVNERLGGTPLLLCLGGEGKGLKSYVTKEASGFVEVLAPEGRREALRDVRLDSLNVSVAAGVVVQEVLARVRAGAALADAAKEVAADATAEASRDDQDDDNELFSLESDADGKIEPADIDATDDLEQEAGANTESSIGNAEDSPEVRKSGEVERSDIAEELQSTYSFVAARIEKKRKNPGLQIIEEFDRHKT